ncbi:MAG: glycosyltransferase family 2 protein [Marinilabiliaceae bacterium]|nr:glycosyltransferase family 2 protein [Marinilabiliaceae bacterium]
MKPITKNYKIISQYLSKHLPDYQIFNKPSKNLEIVVVIPVYKEKNWIFRTLDSLSLCQYPQVDVEVILLFNASENDSEEVLREQKIVSAQIQNQYTYRTVSWLSFVVEERYNIVKKHFGAGMARKLGMDIALARLFSIGKNDGLIVTLDADTLVFPNYFKEIFEWFKDSNKKGASIYFEHPLEGDDFPPEVYDGIIKYELHLRYFLQSLRTTGFPYAFHTMGSAMAMRALAYAQIGGMPRKQAGEDFYFLQKLIPLGGYGEITNTTILPSPRPSDRVIFGTGAAITKLLSGNIEINNTYNYQAFTDLKEFFAMRSILYNLNSQSFYELCHQLPVPIQTFLIETNFYSDLNVLKTNCSNNEIFIKRFWEIFNAFKVVKYLNFVHERFFSKMKVLNAGLKFLENNNYSTEGLDTEKKILEYFRKLEKSMVSSSK